MAVPIIILVGQQVFRVAGTALARRAAKRIGGKIVKKIPENLAKKRSKGEGAFNKLVKDKEPAFADKVGNIFTKPASKVKPSSPGRTNIKEGINVGRVRGAARKRGDQVKGVAKGIGIGAFAGGAAAAKLKMEKLKNKLIEAKTAKKRAEIKAQIEAEMRRLQKEESKRSPLAPKKSLRPRRSPTNSGAVDKSLRPKARP